MDVLAETETKNGLTGSQPFNLPDPNAPDPPPSLFLFQANLQLGSTYLSTGKNLNKAMNATDNYKQPLSLWPMI